MSEVGVRWTLRRLPPSSKFFQGLRYWVSGTGLLAGRRAFSSSRDAESHSITCGSSGRISVDIYNHRLSSSQTPLILYLPSSPTTTPGLPPFLSSHTVARINYRWNHFPSNHLSSSPSFKNHHFPVPLHDVLHAYTWLTSSLSPSVIYVYGSHIGGTLATSLALTESRSSKSSPQIRLIVKDAVFDWTEVATSKDTILSDGNDDMGPEDGKVWTTKTLHKLKPQLFSQPAQCFDSFASPVLFFRTPGLSVPECFPGMEPPPKATETDTMLDNLYIDDDGKIVEGKQLSQSSAPQKKVEEIIDVSKKAHLTFPPRNSGLRIPRSLIITTTPAAASKGRGSAELVRQAQDMVHLMRRSVLLQKSKDRTMWDEAFDPHTEAENRVKYLEILEDSPELEGQVVSDWLEED